MLIVNDDHLMQAGIKSLSKRCSYCSKPLKEYPLIMNDDAGLAVFHAACAAALATEIIVDLYSFFRSPACKFYDLHNKEETLWQIRNLTSSADLNKALRCVK